MQYLEWAEERVGAMSVWDVATLKWSVLLLGIAIGVKGARSLERRVGPIAAAGLALAGWTTYRVLTAKRG